MGKSKIVLNVNIYDDDNRRLAQLYLQDKYKCTKPLNALAGSMNIGQQKSDKMHNKTLAEQLKLGNRSLLTRLLFNRLLLLLLLAEQLKDTV